MEGHLHDILSDSFLELFAEKPDIKDKFFEFRNYTIEDLRKHQPEAEANGMMGWIHASSIHHPPRDG